MLNTVQTDSIHMLCYITSFHTTGGVTSISPLIKAQHPSQDVKPAPSTHKTLHDLYMLYTVIYMYQLTIFMGFMRLSTPYSHGDVVYVESPRWLLLIS